MAISDSLRAKGAALGLAPEQGESSQKFGARIRKVQKDAQAAVDAVKENTSKGSWRRF